jgi:hypothetical protein
MVVYFGQLLNYTISPNVWTSFLLFWQKIAWPTFWAIFSQTLPVALAVNEKYFFGRAGEKRPFCKRHFFPGQLNYVRESIPGPNLRM